MEDTDRQDKIDKLVETRENCPYCDYDESKVLYKGKRRAFKRYFKRLECLACGHIWCTESDKEFTERVEIELNESN